MEFLLSLPLLTGLLMTIAVVVLAGHFIYVGFHQLIQKYLDKKHERMGRVLFRTSAGLLAFIISLSYANYQLAYLKIEESLEEEAAQLVDVYIDLKILDTEEAHSMRKDVENYIQSIIDNQWKYISDKPFTSKTMARFFELYKKAHDLTCENDYQETIKKGILQDLDEVSDFMQVRAYKTQSKTPYLLYIVVIGMVIVYCFYTVYKPDIISITFLALFNVFVAVILYLVLALSNPLTGPLKIEPAPFELIMNKGIKNAQQE